MIVTRTDPRAAKHAGITYFIVDMKSPGIEIRPIHQINGSKDFNEVFFNNVRVPDENRVGAVNDGWRGAITTLMNERASIGSGGGMGFGVSELLRLARETDWNGRPAIEDPSVRERIADFYWKFKGSSTRATARSPRSRAGRRRPGELDRQDDRRAAAPGAVRVRDGAPGRRGCDARRRRDLAAWTRAAGLARLARAAARGRHRRDPAQHPRRARARAAGEIRVDKDKAFQDIPSGTVR
jgi:alkylation response protein AidB-like acyl-CoA dehydrogenase